MAGQNYKLLLEYNKLSVNFFHYLSQRMQYEKKRSLDKLFRIDFGLNRFKNRQSKFLAVLTAPKSKPMDVTHDENE
ncbi:MAG TPA: hypothetical protein VFP93_00510 [Gammaproteobacteria bacterium]|nr:hypothetical protein [Gammaproteobacteria bacterium]